MTEYKIVPVEATEPEVDAAYDANDTIDAPLENGREVARRAVNASRAASPPPREDLVERVATVIQQRSGESMVVSLRTARAILAEIGKKTDV